MIHRLIEFSPALYDILHCLFKGRGFSIDVHPYDVAPDMAVNFDQAKRGAINIFMSIFARTAHMRGADQPAIGGIAPAVIGAADGTFDIFGRLYKDHTPVPAGVLKHPNVV